MRYLKLRKLGGEVFQSRVYDWSELNEALVQLQDVEMECGADCRAAYQSLVQTVRRYGYDLRISKHGDSITIIRGGGE